MTEPRPEVKRYTVNNYDELLEMPDGEYVRLEDYDRDVGFKQEVIDEAAKEHIEMGKRITKATQAAYRWFTEARYWRHGAREWGRNAAELEATIDKQVEKLKGRRKALDELEAMLHRMAEALERCEDGWRKTLHRKSVRNADEIFTATEHALADYRKEYEDV